ncbi:MAG: methyltransferase domain-containing protein [Planctomycetes bacterium]|nr:methyltransferase domain-containing protein [Planctomycetota bacterium]
MQTHAAAPRGGEPEDECPGEVLERERWTRTRVGLGEPRVRFDWEAAFGRSARRVVDLGCGNGLFLIQSGYARPDTDHLGVELVPPSVRMGSLRAGQRGLTNVKFAWGDASEFICERVEPASLDEVHLYHPQPYYDRAKIPRRQLSPRTLLAIWLALREGGLFVFQTDNPEYARYAHENAGQLFEWRPRKAVWEDAPDGRTQRERVARAQGLEIFRVEARRLPLELREVERRVAGMMEPDFDANKKGFDSRSPRGEGGGRRGTRRRA